MITWWGEGQEGKIFFMARQLVLGQGLEIIETSRSHSDTPHSVGLLFTSDEHGAEKTLPDNTQHSQETDLTALGGIRTHNRSKRGGRRPTP